MARGTDAQAVSQLVDEHFTIIEFVEQRQEFRSAEPLRSLISTLAGKKDLRGLKTIGGDIRAPRLVGIGVPIARGEYQRRSAVQHVTRFVLAENSRCNSLPASPA